MQRQLNTSLMFAASSRVIVMSRGLWPFAEPTTAAPVQLTAWPRTFDQNVDKHMIIHTQVLSSPTRPCPSARCTMRLSASRASHAFACARRHICQSGLIALLSADVLYVR